MRDFGAAIGLVFAIDGSIAGNSLSLGWTDPEGSRHNLGALLLGIPRLIEKPNLA